MANTSVMSDPVLHILLALCDEPRHGYAIVQEIEARTQGRVVLGTGTLYSALKRLRREGLITEAAAASAPQATSRKKRTYTLTKRGRTELAAQTERLQALFDHAHQKRALPTQPRTVG